jgi:hypothetical protein
VYYFCLGRWPWPISAAATFTRRNTFQTTRPCHISRVSDGRHLRPVERMVSITVFPWRNSVENKFPARNPLWKQPAPNPQAAPVERVYVLGYARSVSQRKRSSVEWNRIALAGNVQLPWSTGVVREAAAQLRTPWTRYGNNDLRSTFSGTAVFPYEFTFVALLLTPTWLRPYAVPTG